MQINSKQLKEILDKHRRWRLCEPDGERANLRGADLRGADLSDAYLSDASLRGADLRGAYLSDASLRGADLRGAYLRYANLRGADLRGADLSDAYLPAFQLPAGDLIVFKKCSGRIVTLQVASHVSRTASLVGRKCRAASALVLSIEGGNEVVSDRGNLTYRVGEHVYPDRYDDDVRIECTHGIHFFLTREEAKQW